MQSEREEAAAYVHICLGLLSQLELIPHVARAAPCYTLHSPAAANQQPPARGGVRQAAPLLDDICLMYNVTPRQAAPSLAWGPQSL